MAEPVDVDVFVEDIRRICDKIAAVIGGESRLEVCTALITLAHYSVRLTLPDPEALGDLMRQFLDLVGPVVGDPGGPTQQIH